MLVKKKVLFRKNCVIKCIINVYLLSLLFTPNKTSRCKFLKPHKILNNNLFDIFYYV